MGFLNSQSIIKVGIFNRNLEFEFVSLSALQSGYFDLIVFFKDIFFGGYKALINRNILNSGNSSTIVFENYVHSSKNLHPY